MWTTYFKTAWRSLRRGRAFAFLHIGGLALGLTVVGLIAFWIKDELTFNRYHGHYDRIARVGRMETWKGLTGSGFSQSLPLAMTLKENYNEDFERVVLSSFIGEEQILSYKDKHFTQKGAFMQPGGPDLFSLRMISGSLQGRNSILINQSLAQRLFGEEDPIGKTLTFSNGQPATVTGVYEDIPLSSDLHIMTYVSTWDLWMSLPGNSWMQNTDWSDNFMNVYVQLKPGVSIAQVDRQIRDLKLMHVDKEEARGKPRIFLYPMSRWHLYNRFDRGVIEAGDQMSFLWFYGLIGAFVLLLACINFMNLGTVMNVKKAREIGVRKVTGGRRSQLVTQFLIESELIAVTAYLIAILLTWLLLPAFNHIAAKDMRIPWASGVFWLAGVATTLLTGLIAGSYPAFYLSGFAPAKVLKGSFKTKASRPRQFLVAVQFTVTITLIIATLVVYRQVQYAKDRPMGYDQTGLITMRLNFDNKFDVLKQALEETGKVQNVAASVTPLTMIQMENEGVVWKGNPGTDKIDFGTLAVSDDYGKTVGWRFTQGRDFDVQDSDKLVINEAAVKAFGMTHPLGETITWRKQSYQIIGVIRDMVMESPFKTPFPTIFYTRGYKNWLYVKLKPGAIPAVARAFHKIYPQVPFDYHFADDEYDAKFAAEQSTGTLAAFFAALSIIISCLGLFGLASYVAEQRTKELGIRKVLGASKSHLLGLLTKDFTYPIGIAVLVASPLAWTAMHAWLERYAYRTNIPWWLFACAGAGAAVMALLTIGQRGLKAISANPADALRAE
jgi:putative ABC transport system permease protein